VRLEQINLQAGGPPAETKKLFSAWQRKKIQKKLFHWHAASAAARANRIIFWGGGERGLRIYRREKSWRRSNY